MRQPVVDRHVGHDPGSIQKPGLGRHQQQGAFRQDGHQGQPGAARPASEDRIGQHGVEGLAFHRRQLSQFIADKQAGRGKGQGGGHIEHGALAGLHPGLSHDLQAVGDRLNAGIGAAPQGVGMDQQQKDPRPPILGRSTAQLA